MRSRANTGRHKLTPPQLRAEANRAVPSVSTTPGRALAAVKRAEPALGIPAQVVKLIDYLVGRTQAQDWEGGPGLGPIAWPSDAELEDRLNVGPTQRKATVRAALDMGFVRLRRSPNGKRWGHRDKQGRITDAYGFDLAPLVERAAEFERAAAEWEARRAEGKRLRREITCSRNHILSLVDLAVAQDLGGEDWPATAARAEALWRERGEHRDPLALVPIAARLRALAIHVQERVAVALAAVEIVEDKETDPTRAGYRPHCTTTNQLPTAKADTSVPTGVGPDRPQAHGEGGSGDRSARRATAEATTIQNRTAADDAAVDGEPVRGSTPMPCVLRSFVVTPGFILEIAPVFRDWVSTARPGWEELGQAANDIRSALGISPHLWARAWATFGDDGAITVLATLCARHAAGKVQCPGAYLNGMLKRHLAGKLHLDATLYGLVAKTDDARRRTSGAGAGRERRHDRRC